MDKQGETDQEATRPFELVVQPDGMAVFVCGLQAPPDGDAGTLRGLIERALGEAGVVYGIDLAAIDAAAGAAIRESRAQPDFRAASGDPPQPGADGYVEYLFRMAPLIGTISGEEERIDYHERGFFQRVRKGDVLARTVPPEPGVPGRDVFGHEAPAPAGRAARIETAGDAALSEDGTVCIAGSEGVVVSPGRGCVAVFQEFMVNGDVDYHTGNLDMTGVLSIAGWVRAGFKVCATGDIVVAEGIEDAEVKTGGNLTVRRGILCGEHGAIAVGGQLSVQFVENARVRAGGDVVVREGILHSQVTSEGRVLATGGKGHIIGGVLRAAAGVDANELGSRAGVSTVVEAGLNEAARHAIAQLNEYCALYARNEHKIARGVAELGHRKERVAALQPGQRLALAKLIRYRRNVEAARQKISQVRKKLGNAGAIVQVRKAVHEGTTLEIMGARMDVRSTMTCPGAFVWDAETEQVVFREEHIPSSERTM